MYDYFYPWKLDEFISLWQYVTRFVLVLDFQFWINYFSLSLSLRYLSNLVYIPFASRYDGMGDSWFFRFDWMVPTVGQIQYLGRTIIKRPRLSYISGTCSIIDAPTLDHFLILVCVSARHSLDDKKNDFDCSSW